MPETNTSKSDPGYELRIEGRMRRQKDANMVTGVGADNDKVTDVRMPIQAPGCGTKEMGERTL